MDFKVMALDKLVKWLLGGELFDFIREQVNTASRIDISGDESVRARPYGRPAHGSQIPQRNPATDPQTPHGVWAGLCTWL